MPQGYPCITIKLTGNGSNLDMLKLTPLKSVVLKRAHNTQYEGDKEKADKQAAKLKLKLKLQHIKDEEKERKEKEAFNEAQRRQRVQAIYGNEIVTESNFYKWINS